MACLKISIRLYSRYENENLFQFARSLLLISGIRCGKVSVKVEDRVRRQQAGSINYLAEVRHSHGWKPNKRKEFFHFRDHRHRSVSTVFNENWLGPHFRNTIVEI